MAQKPMTSPHLDAIHIVLILAAVFAIGSVGFFLAILLGHAYAPMISTASGELTSTQKNAIVSSVNAPASTSSASAASGSQAQTAVAPSVSAQQASQNDTNAAAKLEILNSLNSH